MWTMELVYIGVNQGTLNFVSPDKIEGTHTIEYYALSADGDGDGLPDPGAVPRISVQLRDGGHAAAITVMARAGPRLNAGVLLSVTADNQGEYAALRHRACVEEQGQRDHPDERPKRPSPPGP